MPDPRLLRMLHPVGTYQAEAVRIRNGKDRAAYIRSLPEEAQEEVKSHVRTYLKIVKRARRRRD